MKNTTERRQNILKVLCERRYERIENLATEFNVSRRTIQYDVQILSCTYPLYTETGIYGGVYVADGFYLGMKYLTDKQEAFLVSILDCFSAQEQEILETIIDTFRKPRVKKILKAGEHGYINERNDN